ncbi:hypothetical protein [Catellatospora vulcania]|uniref:hypothetical protein n=1 Tax=Catellatospora vulcania TaxID=1460450 RepID=UPI0012D3CCE1|nr:hypothetical protein [Catellatospora vulcania]
MTASPAAAGPCTVYPCKTVNNTNRFVELADDWCYGDTSPEFEDYACPPGQPRVVTPYGTFWDADAFQSQTGCVTRAQLRDGTDSITVASWDDDRRGKPSIWHKFGDGRILKITYKQCYGQGVSATSTSNSVTLYWNGIPGVTYRVYRFGTHVWSGQGGMFTDAGLGAGTSYSYEVSTNSPYTYDGVHTPISVTTNNTPPPDVPPAGTAPTWIPNTAGMGYYYATTFANTDGLLGSDYRGTLWAGTSYFRCSAPAGYVEGEYGFNHYWMWTDLDTPWGSTGWVSAYYLANWPSDVVKADNGADIPPC